MGRSRYCKTCRFWDTTASECDCCGDCRGATPMIQVDVDKDGLPAYLAVWPSTAEHDWCGKHREILPGVE